MKKKTDPQIKSVTLLAAQYTKAEKRRLGEMHYPSDVDYYSLPNRNHPDRPSKSGFLCADYVGQWGLRDGSVFNLSLPKKVEIQFTEGVATPDRPKRPKGRGWQPLHIVVAKYLHWEVRVGVPNVGQWVAGPVVWTFTFDRFDAFLLAEMRTWKAFRKLDYEESQGYITYFRIRKAK